MNREEKIGVKLPAHRAGLSDKELLNDSVPLDPACRAGLAEALPANFLWGLLWCGEVVQISLFDDRYLLLNEGTSALIDLDLEAARMKLQLFKKRYQERGDVDKKLVITEFLRKGLQNIVPASSEEPSHLYNLWCSFEKFVETERVDVPNLVKAIKKSFFVYLIASLERGNVNDNACLCGSIPLGRIFIEAGQYDRAIASLQSALLVFPEKASLLYGYLGDAYAAKGELSVARRCYFEGCLADAGGIDWARIRDEELAALKKELATQRGMEEREAAEWLPSCAYIAGLFPPKVMRLKDELKSFVDSYLDRYKAYRKKCDALLKPQLFIRAIILCDNKETLRHVRGVDFIALRTLMKELDPLLFSHYMERLRGGRASGRKG